MLATVKRIAAHYRTTPQRIVRPYGTASQDARALLVLYLTRQGKTPEWISRFLSITPTRVMEIAHEAEIRLLPEEELIIKG